MTREYRKKPAQIWAIYGIFMNDELVYVGSSTNLRRRLRQHEHQLEIGTHTIKTLQDHYNTHKSLEFGYLELVTGDVSKSGLLKLEQEYIELMQPKFNSIYAKKSITNARHGSSNGYDYHKCRCDACMQWMRDYQRARRKRLEQNRPNSYIR